MEALVSTAGSETQASGRGGASRLCSCASDAVWVILKIDLLHRNPLLPIASSLVAPDQIKRPRCHSCMVKLTSSYTLLTLPYRP
jgi:hypothetical protein